MALCSSELAYMEGIINYNLFSALLRSTTCMLIDLIRVFLKWICTKLAILASNAFLKDNKQECIPVGWVLPMAVAIPGGLLQCMHTPWVWAWRPLGVDLETPLGQTPQLPPWVWAWRPPWQGMLGNHQQGMLGYHHPPCKTCWDTTCNVCWDTTPPLPWTEWQTRVKT